MSRKKEIKSNTDFEDILENDYRDPERLKTLLGKYTEILDLYTQIQTELGLIAKKYPDYTKAVFLACQAQIENAIDLLEGGNFALHSNEAKVEDDIPDLIEILKLYLNELQGKYVIAILEVAAGLERQLQRSAQKLKIENDSGDQDTSRNPE